ncbi:MAG: hypothetical protein ACOC1K_08115 [Nanoarchaeota archaeon]
MKKYKNKIEELLNKITIFENEFSKNWDCEDLKEANMMCKYETYFHSINEISYIYLNCFDFIIFIIKDIKKHINIIINEK